MELNGETVVFAARERVWRALNDPAVLARCLEGVESLERVADDRFEGRMQAKVGPVRATFTGVVTLSELDPPNSYRLSGEGNGGAAGFARGTAEVRLTDEPGEDGRPATRLAYVARSTVGGKLAQLGTRLIEGTARSYAESFFRRFKDEVERDGAIGGGMTGAAAAAFAGAADGGGAEVAASGPAFDSGEAAEAAALVEVQPTMAAAGPTPPLVSHTPASEHSTDDAGEAEAHPPAAEGSGLPPLAWGALVCTAVLVLLIALLA